MTRSRVTVTIVAWNSMMFLPDALASLMTQTFRDFSVVVVDNASSDGVAEFIHEKYPDVAVIRNPRNRGFAHAHNQAIEYARAYHRKDDAEHYVLVTNPDVVLEPDFLEKLVAAADHDEQAGAVGGMLLRIHREGEGELVEGVRTDVIDSAGIRVSRARRITDRGAGESAENDQYNVKREVFGLTAALVLYRLSALEDVAYHNEYFDEDFFVYKEDIDLAWRLRLRGWKALYVPAAKAYHYRGAGIDDRAGAWRTFRNRKRKPAIVNYHSSKNHLFLLAKNEQWRNGLIDAWRIVPYELMKFLHVALFETRNLGAYVTYLRMLPRMLRKRRLIMERARVSAKEMRSWFLG